jgi:hypothetical protein
MSKNNYLKDANDLVHAARRHQAQAERIRQEAHKRGLVTSIEQRKAEGKKTQVVQARRQYHFSRAWAVLSLTGSMIAAVLALGFGGWVALAGIGVNPTEPRPCMNLASDENEFSRVADFVAAVFDSRANGGDPVRFSGLVGGGEAAQTAEVLGDVSDQPVKVLSIQANRESGEYLVYCDFGVKGRILMQIADAESGLQVVFAESYF